MEAEFRPLLCTSKLIIGDRLDAKCCEDDAIFLFLLASFKVSRLERVDFERVSDAGAC